MSGTCSVYGGNNTSSKTVSLHSLPKDKKLRKIWIERLYRSDKFNVSSARICSEHFNHQDFERDLRNELVGLPLRKILKKDAILRTRFVSASIQSRGNASSLKRKQSCQEEPVGSEFLCIEPKRTRTIVEVSTQTDQCCGSESNTVTCLKFKLQHQAKIIKSLREKIKNCALNSSSAFDGGM